MTKYNKTEHIAHQQLHPKRPILGWEVVHCGKVVYENESIRLCQHYITSHNLTGAKPRAKY